MQLKLYHSVNSAVYVEGDAEGLWIDGIHKGKTVGFSDMPQELKVQMMRREGLFASTGGLLYTHLHPDHYDGELAEFFIEKRGCSCYGPGLEAATLYPVPLEKNLDLIRMEKFDVFALYTTHDGPAKLQVPHRAYLIRAGGDAILVSGDSRFCPEEADVIARYVKSLSAMLVNFYQLSDPDSLAFIRKLQPRRILIYHLPFPEDDAFQTAHQTREVLRRYPADLPPCEYLPHMAWLDGQAGICKWPGGANCI